MSNWPTGEKNVSSNEETQEQFEARRDAEIKKWIASKEAFNNIKSDEMDNRKIVFSTCFPNPKKGTQRYELGNGYKIKLVHKINFSLGDKDLIDGSGDKIPIEKQVADALDKIANLGNEGVFFAKSLVTWKPNFNESVYKKLDTSMPFQAKVKEIIDEILTSKEASPTLEFEEPKEPKS